MNNIDNVNKKKNKMYGIIETLRFFFKLNNGLTKIVWLIGSLKVHALHKDMVSPFPSSRSLIKNWSYIFLLKANSSLMITLLMSH